MRAFIFSLDAFVAFTLALVAIYSLIFFSSIPSSYYYLLTQGHYLARDVLFSISTADCVHPICSDPEASILDNIVFGYRTDFQKPLINETIGRAIPSQFGYKVEVRVDEDGLWNELYDTGKEPGDTHAKKMRKLSVSSVVPVFEYVSEQKKDINPYIYTSCMGDGFDTLITCSTPSDDADSDTIVPLLGVRLLRLTIFI
jgi:hypothetical protein